MELSSDRDAARELRSGGANVGREGLPRESPSEHRWVAMFPTVLLLPVLFVLECLCWNGVLGQRMPKRRGWVVRMTALVKLELVVSGIGLSSRL